MASIPTWICQIPTINNHFPSILIGSFAYKYYCLQSSFHKHRQVKKIRWMWEEMIRTTNM